MFGLGWPELVLILLIVVLIFGASRIKNVAKALGEGIREFKKATSESSNTNEEEAIIKAAKKMGIKTDGKSVDQLSSEIEKVI